MTLPGRVEAAIVAHARESAPAECCGLLLGEADTIVQAQPVRNAADDPTRRYLVDPRDHLKVIRDARRQGLAVVGVYHSHPRSSATPSPTDAAEAFAEFIFLIVGLGAPAPEIAAWEWVDGNFVAVPIVRSV